jgi:N-acylneuraminate cytidylyltransferase/CMP-N,N'-diacetyllegionaminic acid synthase
MKILGVIPARKGSVTIKNKNLYPICGVPMLQYTLSAACESSLDDIVISTDYDPMIFEGNVTIIERPEHLATSKTKMIDVMQHVAKFMDYDAYMILQPTSPLRLVDDIEEAIERFAAEENATSLYSGYYMGLKHKEKAYDKLENELHFQRNGAIFIMTKELIKQGKLWDENVIQFEMPKSRSIDIDDMDDMQMAEALIAYDVFGD